MTPRCLERIEERRRTQPRVCAGLGLAILLCGCAGAPEWSEDQLNARGEATTAVEGDTVVRRPRSRRARPTAARTPPSPLVQIGRSWLYSSLFVAAKARSQHLQVVDADGVTVGRFDHDQR